MNELPDIQEEAWTAIKDLEGALAIYDSLRIITVVQRHTADEAAVVAGSRHRSPVQQISVDNDTTTGIAASEFVAGKTITIDRRAGGGIGTMRLARIVKQNDIFVTYEVH